jgi:hypothetical protein
MGILSSIKNDVKKSGGSRGKIWYLKEGEKARIRFLTEMDDGMEIVFHDSYEAGINVPCAEAFGKRCKHCDDDSLRTRSMYAWSVYDYESKGVRLFLFAVNNCSPLPPLLALQEQYGTLTDRDLVLTVSGKRQNKSFSVVPMDKNSFKNKKAKPFSEKEILEIIKAAYPDDSADDDDDEEEKPRKGKGKGAASKGKGSKKKPEPEPEEDEEEEEDWEEDEDEEEELDYSSLSARELYKLCKEREIDVKPKKTEKFYIKKLEEYDAAMDDEDEDEEDEWEDEE